LLSGCPGLRLAARRRPGGAAPRQRGPAAGRRGPPNNAMFAGKMYHNFQVEMQW